jgi:hypothetical protein
MCATGLLGALILVGSFPGSTDPAQAATSPYFKLSVTPTEDLTDGATMTVTVTRTAAGTAAGLQISQLGTGWCTAGFQVPTNVGVFTPLTFAGLPAITGPHTHCTTAMHPLNGTLRSASSISPPLNSAHDYPTVTASVDAESSEGTTVHTGATLICDASSPCTFVVAVFTTATTLPSTTVFLSVPVTYLPTTFSADCGGVAPGQLTTVGPDRLGQQVTNWTIDACNGGVGGGKALTQNLASEQGDATALADFASGVADLAYSAVGYGATPAFTPPVDRPYVAVPIAINAVVLAHIETDPIANPARLGNVFGDYPQLYITDAQAAALLGGGPSTTSIYWDSPLGKALVSENPSLDVGPYYSPTSSITTNGTLNNKNPSNGIVGTSLADATTLFATSFFHTVVPNGMVSTTTGDALGVTSDFGTAHPAYNILGATGLELLDKDLSPGLAQGFALTNALTAANTWGGMADFALQTPGSIGSATPQYVTPNVSSMQAAVAEMIPQPDGTLEPNPNATAEHGVLAYPLTYVEYAIAPTQPLLNGDCSPRTKSEQDLIDWLTYITGPGQSELGNGLAPLTPFLQAQARNAIAQVGTATPTGPCTPGVAPSTGTSTTTSTSTTTTVPAASTVAPSGAATVTTSATAEAPAAAFSAGGSGVPTHSSATTSGASTKTLSKKSSTSGSAGSVKPLAVDLARFREATGSGWYVPVVGVLLLVLLLPGLALLISGRSPRQLFALLTGRSAPGPGPPQ